MARNNYDKAPVEREEKMKRELLSKICTQLQKSKKAIIIEKVRLFNNNRLGIVYIPDKNQTIYFSQNGMGKVQLVEHNTYNYEALKKILDIVKYDFYDNSAQLTSYFKTIIAADASSLNLVMLDAEETNRKDVFYAFKYLPHIIMSKEFDYEFGDE